MGNGYGMPRGQITSLTKANKTSESLRTTVPSSVIKQFDLKEGDQLRWRFETDKKGEIFVKIEPIRGESTGKERGGGQVNA
jgi:transcription termination factor Rho